MVMERDTGFLVKLYDDVEYFADEPYSDNLRGLLMSAHQAGFRMMEFDSDATILEDTPYFDLGVQPERRVALAALFIVR